MKLFSSNKNNRNSFQIENQHSYPPHHHPLLNSHQTICSQKLSRFSYNHSNHGFNFCLALPVPWMKPFPYFCPQAANGAATLGTLLPSPSVTCLVVQPRPRSGSVEADPAYQTCSFRGFCHHMADPGPAASPGGTCAWIREKISGCTSVHITLSILSMTTQMLFQQIGITNLFNKLQQESYWFFFIFFIFFSIFRKKRKNYIMAQFGE